MLVAIILVAHALGIISSVHAIMDTRTAQGAIAWLVSLNTLPYIAVPAYWVFGRSRFHGYVRARRHHDGYVYPVYQQVRQNVEGSRAPATRMDDARHAAENLADLPFTTGNEAELLVDGEATFASILEGIDVAKSYVLFQFFIVHDDEIGRKVKSHLVEKARAGVRVFFLYDEVGSHDLPSSYKAALREAGVEVSEFHARKGPRNRFQLNFRNHRKIVVVDGRVAWIGGHNVGDEYLGKSRFGHWRDTHVRIEGPAALAAQLSFVEDWNWATGRLLDLSWTPATTDGADAVLVVPSGPADELETATLMFTHAINSASRRIWISSPYFVPDQGMIAALQLAGLRGVDVRILIPSRADHLLVYLASFSYFDEAGRTGVKFYRYDDGFLHEKAMLVDDQTATIGTANFDNRSFRLNFEITAIIAGRGFLAKVEDMFENDLAKSTPVTRSEYDQKSFWFKLAVKLARLTAPIQ